MRYTTQHLSPVPDGQTVQPGHYERPVHYVGQRRRHVSTSVLASLATVQWAGIGLAALTLAGQLAK
jgi:hypothetical protein